MTNNQKDTLSLSYWQGQVRELKQEIHELKQQCEAENIVCDSYRNDRDTLRLHVEHLREILHDSWGAMDMFDHSPGSMRDDWNFDDEKDDITKALNQTPDRSLCEVRTNIIREVFEAKRTIPSHMRYNGVMNRYYAHDYIKRKTGQDNLNREWVAFQDGWKAAQPAVPEGCVKVDEELYDHAVELHEDAAADAQEGATYRAPPKWVNNVIDAYHGAQPQPDWIACSERLPTADDRDFMGEVVWYFPGGHIQFLRDTWCDPIAMRRATHWKPTMAQRPEPPEDV